MNESEDMEKVLICGKSEASAYNTISMYTLNSNITLTHILIFSIFREATGSNNQLQFLVWAQYILNLNNAYIS